MKKTILFSVLGFVLSLVAATSALAAGPMVALNVAARNVIAPGDTLALSVTANGTGTVNYQWTRNGLPIGTNSATYTISPATLQDTGYYLVLATDDTGSTLSATMFVTVAPAITQVRVWGDNTFGQATPPAALADAVAIADGVDHALAIKRDGTLVGWGSNTSGQLNIPAGLTGVVAVSASGENPWSVALKSDGTVVAWGDDTFGQIDVPAGLTNVVAICSNGLFNLALKSDGTVVGWGYDGDGGTNVPAGLTGVVAITNGDNDSYALKTDGSIIAWGYNGYGQLNIPAGLVATAVTAGDSITAALRADGSIIAWGYDGYGGAEPPAVTAVAIASGGLHLLALKADGTVVGWGNDYQSRSIPPSDLANVYVIKDNVALGMALRDGTGDSAPSITVSPASQTVGETSPVTFTVTATGTGPFGYQWRKNSVPIAGATFATYQIVNAAPGDAGSYDVILTNHIGTATSGAATLTVNPGPTITALTSPQQFLSTGSALNLSVSATGSGALTYQWFHNGAAIGGATASTFSIPVTAGQNSGYYYVLVTDTSNSAAKRSATIFATITPAATELRAWGADPNGETDIPNGLTNAAAVSAGGFHTLALLNDGTLAAWGLNTEGQTTVPTGSANVAIAAGGHHSVALESDGTVVAWGRDVEGQTNVPSGLANVVAISAGLTHTLALKSDGTVVAWGDNTYGQVNVPPGLINVVAIAAGAYHSLVLKSDGTLVAWGRNSQNQTNVPGGSNFVAISANGHSLALRNDGTVAAWGVDDNGQAEVPGSLSGVVAVAAGGSHSLALAGDGTVVGWGRDVEGQTTIPSDLANVIAISANSNFSFALRDASNDAAPVVTVPPASQTVVAFQHVVLSVTATGFEPTYQWRFNTTPISGATSATLDLGNVPVSAAGNYDVVVTNYLGSDTSAAAILTVNQATPNITWGALADITFGAALNGTQLDASANVSGSFAYNPDFGAVLGAGSQTLNVTFTPDDSTNYTTASAQNTLVVDQAPATFALDSTSFTYNGSAQGPTIVPTPSGATFTPGGTLTATNAGSYTATATATGNFSGANNSLGWTIAKAGQSAPTIMSASSTTFGATYTATASSGFGAVIWSLGAGSTASNPAINSSTGVISYSSAGTVVINATFAGDSNHNAATSADFTVAVDPIATTFALNSTSFTYTGSAQGPTVNSTPSDATFNSGGTLSATSAGSYTATATATGNYSGTNNSLGWTIAKAAQSAPTITSATTTTFGTTYTATANTGIGAVSWALGSGSSASGAAIDAVTGVISYTSVGTVVINATFAGDANHSAATSADFTVTIGKAAQPAPVISSATSAAFGDSYTATANTGIGALSWALGTGSTASDAAIDSTTGVVTYSSIGTVVINATFAGDTNHNAATSADFTITFGQASATFALSSTTFVYTGSAQGPTVVPTPSDATFSSGGTLSATAAGSYTATAAATGNFTGSNNSLGWTIAKAAQSAPTISSASSTTFGAAYTAAANSGIGALSWALGTGSSAAGAAIDPSTGVVTYSSVGTVVINATFAGDTNHNGATSADFTVTVGKADQAAPVISSASTAAFGDSYTATANSGIGALSWALGTGSTAAGAAIDSTTGVVTYSSVGTVVINATFAGDTNHNPATSADFTITFGQAPTTFALDSTAFTYTGSAQGPNIVPTPSDATFTPGGTLSAINAGGYTATAAATGNFSGTNNSLGWAIAKAGQSAPTISSASSTTFGAAYTATANTGIGALSWALGTGSTATGAAIDATTGVVSYSSVGTVVINATFAGDTNHNPATSANFTVTINQAPTTFALSATTFTYTGSAQGPTINPTPGGATFTPGGTLSATNAGSYTGTATATGNFSGTNNSLGWTIAKAGQSAPTITSANSTTFGATYTATANTGIGALSWALGSGSTASNASIDSATGVISYSSAGTVVINATFAGNANHNPATSADFTVAVDPVATTFALSSTSFTYNGAAQGPTINPTPSNATFTPGGTLSATAAGSYTATAAATGNFSGTNNSLGWAIAKAGQSAPTITSAASTTFGASYTATANTGTGALTWALGTGSTATGAAIDATTGVVSYSSVGTVVINATFAGDANHNAATSADFTVTVAKADQPAPVISSDTSIAFGDPYTATANTGIGALSWALGTGSTAAGAAIDSSTGVISYSSSGSVIINATFAGDANHNPATSADFTVSIGVTPTTFMLSSTSFVYTGAVQGPTIIPNPSGANFTSGGTLSATNAGSYNATAAATGNFTGTNNSLGWTIAKAGQSAPTITSANSTTFGASYTATANSGIGATSWALGAGSTATSAAIDPTTGVVTYSSIGTVVINATFAGDANHNGATSADFTVTVAKANQPAPVISSANSAAFGDSYTAAANTGIGALTWALGTGSTATGAAIDATTGVVTYSSVGTVVINATFAGDANHNPATSADFTVTFGQQATTFALSSTTFVYTGAVQGPTIVPTPSNATFSSGGTLSATAAGSYNATAAGTGNFTGSNNSLGWTIAKAAQPSPTITSANSINFGASYTATANSGIGATSWALGAGSTATGAAIDPTTGVVTYSSVGTVVFNATFAGDANHNPATSADFTVTVGQSPTTFALSSTTFTYTGAAQGPTINPTPSNATFNSGGTLSTTNAGSYTATATATGNFTGTNNSLGWTIAKAAQPSPTITSANATVFGTTYTATASTGIGATSWGLGTGSTAGTAAIDSVTGVISYSSVGTVVINATFAGDSNHNAATSSNLVITVAKAGQSAPVISSANSTVFGATYTATANTGIGALNWALGTGSTAAGAAINATTGVISYSSVGTVVINGTFAGDANHNPATSADFTITVGQAPATFALSSTAFTYTGAAQGPTINPTPSNATFTPGGTLSATNAGSYTATAAATGNFTGTNNSLGWTIAKAGQPAPAITSAATTTFGASYTAAANTGTGALSWALGAGSTATGAAIDAVTGVVSYSSVGTVVINATFAGDSNTNSATSADFTVTVGKAAQAAPTITSAASTTFGATYTATANTGIGALSWALGAGSTATGAAIDATTGVISYSTVGTVVINATFAGDANHNPATSADFTIAVNPIAATFALSSTSFTYTGAAQGPTINPTPSNATFTPGGTVSATNAGSYTATATATGNYTGANSSLGWTIGQATASVTLGNLTATYDGTPKSASATTNPTGLTLALTYNGSATAPTGAGSYAVVGTVNDTNYTGSASGTLVIAKGTPGVTWPAPAPIIHGTALGSAQYNATSSVPGTFTYDPVAGTVLSTGTHTLAAVFAPTDSTDYSSVTVSRTINVYPAYAVMAGGDFNNDGKPDIILTNMTTGERVIWLMNGTTPTSSVSLGVTPLVWEIDGTGDFNGDGHTDIVLTNTSTGERAIWLMNGTTVTSVVSLGVTSTDWSIVATGDFNGDHKTDLLLTNMVTGERDFWLMNGTTVSSTVSLGVIPVSWAIAGAGDFNGDGQPDIIWQNAATGERLVWLMNGTTPITGISLGTTSTDWSIVGAGDYNGDGQTDLLLVNNLTGEVSVWLMDGTTVTGSVSIGIAGVDWAVSPPVTRTAQLDFNADGMSDLLWQNAITGDRLIWLMNGTTPVTALDLGIIPTDWSIGATGDFNADGHADLVWQNSATGERLIWLMNGTTPFNAISLGTVSTDWVIVGAGDLNGDGTSDLLWTNTVTGERSVWLMNGTTPGATVSLGIVPFQWSLAGTGDFNGDGQTDLLWQNTLTGDINVWLMNGTTPASIVSLGNVSPQLQIAGTGDYNNDGSPDILFTNRVTGERTVWLMSSTAHSSTISLATAPLEWVLIHPVAQRVWADFNDDGKSDLLWQNTATGESLVFLMNGTTPFDAVSIGTADPNLQIAATGDFNSDGKADIVWQNLSTGDRFIWLMNGATLGSSVDLGVVSTVWTIVGTGDFNADGNSDLLWKNTVTNEYVIWLMNGTTPVTGVSLGIVSSQLQFAGTGDFNADGSTDLVWQNTATGERLIWLMNGTTFASSVSLGTVSTDWSLTGTGDFNGDGQPDLLWVNTVTGDRLVWLMNGTTPFNGVSLGSYPTVWVIKN